MQKKTKELATPDSKSLGANGTVKEDGGMLDKISAEGPLPDSGERAMEECGPLLATPEKKNPEHIGTDPDEKHVEITAIQEALPAGRSGPPPVTPDEILDQIENDPASSPFEAMVESVIPTVHGILFKKLTRFTFFHYERSSLILVERGYSHEVLGPQPGLY